MQSIDVLSEVCHSLYAVLGGWETELARTEDEDEETEAVRDVTRRVLADAQTRLVFRAEGFLREEVERFPNLKLSEIEALGNMRRAASMAAAIGDGLAGTVSSTLPKPIAKTDSSKDAPATLPVEQDTEVAASSESAPLMPEPAHEDDSQRTASAADGSDALPATETPAKRAPFGIGKMVYGGGEHYPTVQRTLYLLGKLYRCVTPPVFEDLAQEAVDMCRRIVIGISERADPGQVGNKSVKRVLEPED